VDEDDAEFFEVPCSRDEEHIDAEISLCQALSQWDPFSNPAPEVVAAMKTLEAVLQGRSKKEPYAQAVLAGQHAISQLALEGCVLQAR
jgi:hypothetical protein